MLSFSIQYPVSQRKLLESWIFSIENTTWRNSDEALEFHNNQVNAFLKWTSA